MNNIVKYENRLNKKGELVPINDGDETPYYGIGIVELYKDFDNILEEFHKISKNKEKDKYYKIIFDNKDKVFITKIPVFSPTLRPALIQKDSVRFDEINTYYSLIIKNANIIMNSSEEELNEMSAYPLVTVIQEQMLEVFNKVIESISGKSGFIRNNIMGSRINFSARAVITPLPAGSHLDEAHMPYLTFLEIYKFHILNILIKSRDMSYFDAHRMWFRSRVKFDPEIYNVMMEILNNTEGGIEFLLNRNPTINIGSILKLRLTGIKQDTSDLTLSISNIILAPMGGDYDGDSAKRSV